MRIPTFKGNIVVSNLSADISSAELATLFDPFGLVLGAKIERWHDRPGGTRGLVDLAPDTAVDKAIAALDGQPIGAIKVSVRRAPPPKKKAPAAPKRMEAPRQPAAAATAQPGRPAAGPSDYHAVTATTRKVLVEYRPAPRRVVLPPRRAGSGSVAG
jgi:hypothetical protein